MKIVSILALLSIYLIACNNNTTEIKISRSEPVAIDSHPAECPYLTHDSEGNIVMSWVRMGEEGKTDFCYAISQDQKTFSSPVIIPNTSKIQPHGENMPQSRPLVMTRS